MDTNKSLQHNSNAVNSTSSPDNYENVRYNLNIMSLCVYGVACVLGVLGNGAVIWVTGFKMKKSVNTVWFLNLAVADFLFTAFLPLAITYQGLGFDWVFGKFMCKLNSTITVLNLFASVYTLVVISVDRFVSVVWPIWAQIHRNVRKASYVCLLVWAFALSFSIPNFIFRDTVVHNNHTFCYSNFAGSENSSDASVTELITFRHQAMTITRIVVGFIIPFTVIVFCYGIIIYRIRSSSTLAKQSSRPVKIITTIIITFFLCWAPSHIMSIVELFKFLPSNKNNTLLYVISIGIPVTTSLAYLNSCLNPILYVFIGQGFKVKVCKSILKVLETAFQEDETNTYSKSHSTSDSKKSDNSTAV